MERAMKEYNNDTSAEYDDMVGYVSEENLPSNLGDFLGIKDNNPPKVKPKPRDSEFPEDWQKITVNFRTHQDYVDFMFAINEKPMPKLKNLVYEADRDDVGLMGFFGE